MTYLLLILALVYAIVDITLRANNVEWTAGNYLLTVAEIVWCLLTVATLYIDRE